MSNLLAAYKLLKGCLQTEAACRLLNELLTAAYELLKSCSSAAK
jgi:hypothetical protein